MPTEIPPSVAQFLAQVDWLYVVVLAVFAFVASALGNLLAFGNRMNAAVMSALLFAAIFVGWTYYPHGLPLPTAPTAKVAKVAVPTGPVATPPPVSAPIRPANPVRDITPPKP